MTDAFVGRDKEMQQLRTALETIDAAPAIVLIGGDPGIGKSRLIDNFGQHAVARGAQVLSGDCVHGGEVPYAPLIDALRKLVRRKDEEYARTLVGDAWKDLAGLISDFTGQESAAESPALGSQVRVFGAVLRLLDAVGASAPLVLIFEDVHWADKSTLDLIRYLARAMSNHRVMLVCTYRTGLDQGHPLRALLAEPQFVTRATRVNLGGLSPVEMRKLLSALSPTAIDRDQAQRYLELSGGNPFYAGLLLAASDPADPMLRALPDDLTEIIRTQLERLSSNARTVLRVAATAARRVSDDLIAAMTDLEDRALDDAVRECLEERVLIFDRADETYAFRHALLRETVYQGLTRREQRRLHAAMAEALSTDPRPGAAVELAHHWFRADRKPEALAAAIRAGGTAVRMRAFQEAQAQYARALDLWPHVADPEAVAGTPQEQILADAAEAARWAGNVDQAVRWVHDAIDKVDIAVEPRRAGELYERLGSFQWEAGSIDESVAATEMAQRCLQDLPPTALTARVAATLATAAIRAGRYGEGHRRATAALELARQVGARGEQGRALNSAGLALGMLGRAEDGETYLRDSLTIAAEVDHLEDLFRAYGNLGLVLEAAGNLAGAYAVLEKAMGEARTLGLFDSRQGGVLANNACAVLNLLGRWGEAEALITEVIADRPVKETLYPRLTLAEIHVARGDFETARRLLADVRSRPNHDPRFVGPLYTCLAELDLWQHDFARALLAVENGIDATASTESTVVALHLYAVGLRAHAAGRSQDPADRSEWIRQVRSIDHDNPTAPETGVLIRLCEAEWRRAEGADQSSDWLAIADDWAALQRPYPEAYARWRATGALLRANDRAGAVVAARAARQIAERLGARPLLTQIDTTVADNLLDLAEADPAVVAQRAAADSHGLTAREFAVLRHVCMGLSNREIGKTLYISESTVSVHLTNTYQKLHCRSRAEAIAIATKRGFYPELLAGKESG